MMSLAQVQALARTKLLDRRSIDYFVYTAKFERAYEVTEDKELFIKCIEEGRPKELRDLVNRTIKVSCSLEDASVRHLRFVAGQLGIPNVCRYQKTELIRLIKETRNEKR